MAITCTKCGTAKVVRRRERPTKGQLSRYLICPACQARAVQAYKLRNPEKRDAHRAVASAKRRGRLIPKGCEVCGSTEGVEAHHDDYERPLEVRWLCRRHHRALHRSGGGVGKPRPGELHRLGDET